MNKKELIAEFQSPSAAYRGKPFWSWNGELKERELVRQTKVMKKMGLGGYFMHSRAGLITEYLGDEWFDLINAVADAAEKDGMEAWLYDEDRWPSGSAGGKVTVDPQYRMKSLYVYESDPERFTDRTDTVAVYLAKVEGLNLWGKKRLALTDGGLRAEDLRAEADALAATVATEKPGEWRVLHFAILPDAPDSNYNGTTYIDTMSRKAVDCFIELTHEEYKKRCGDRLGRSIKGIFTDEPHRGKCFDNLQDKDGVRSCAVCWTDDIFAEFQKRYGYDAEALLPELFYRWQGEAVAPVKLHYIDLADHLFIERFAKPINEWCQRNGIIFTGHVLHEDSLMNQTVPHGSLMRFYEHMGYPGVDCLTEHNRCYWIVKQLASATRQLGQKWLLSELYGCTGWQFDFKAHKAVGDWQALFGINLRCQHLSWYTMEGESKRDYPASILHQSPWYPYYSTVEDYFARFGVVMSEGEADCDVLLLNPIESLWCQAYLGWANWIRNASPDVAPYEKRYAEIFHMLIDRHVDFDYGEEEMMSRLARVEMTPKGEPMLCVGKARYKTVILTNMLTVRPSTLDLLEEFMKCGGKVIFAGELPKYVDAVASDRPVVLSQSPNALRVELEEEALVRAVRSVTEAYVDVLRTDGSAEKQVFTQVRRGFCGDGYAVVLLNTDRVEAKSDLTLKIKADGVRTVQQWNFETGERTNVTDIAEITPRGVTLHLDLEAAGTVCFVLTRDAEALPKHVEYRTLRQTCAVDDFAYSLDEENVCVLDFVKWRLDGGEWHDEEEVLRADRHVRDLIGIERRGGGMLQPWYAKLKYTETYGRLCLSYEFFIDELPRGEVFLAGERPTLNHFAVNGVALEDWSEDDFWVDDCFKRMRIPAGVLKKGRNVVTADPTFMRTTNVEAVYLLGHFGVALDGKTRRIISLPEKLGCENHERYGLPFYTGSVTYHIPPALYQDALGEDPEKADRILLTPKDFVGGCAVVTALGRSRVLGWEPYEADVTDACRQGAPIDLTVVGTRRNVFGPLHQTAKIAPSCGPGSFVTSGDRYCEEYSLIDSGMRGVIFRVQEKVIK